MSVAIYWIKLEAYAYFLGLSAETLLNKTDINSPLDKFRSLLAKYLKPQPSSIDIFSVIPIPYRWPKLVDVWFSAKTQLNDYMDSITLNSIVDLYRSDFETALGGGAKIVEVGVNACLDSSCTTGCINDITASPNTTTINANSTSLVGVTVAVSLFPPENHNLELIDIFLQTKATCDSCPMATLPTGCTSESCLNHGACHGGPFGFLYVC